MENIFPFVLTGSFLFIIISLLVLFAAASYIYVSLAWMAIARKLRYSSPWIAFIPVVRKALILHLGGLHWAWIFLILVPVFGWLALFILGIVARWRVYEKRLYPGWFSLAILLPSIGHIAYLVILGFVAWQDRKKMLTF